MIITKSFTFLIVLSCCMLATACRKDNKTTINNNTYDNDATPAYVVLGLHDLTFTNGFGDQLGLAVTVQYMDSTQQSVDLSVSGLPDGITIDSNWIRSGYPTYSTGIQFRNDNAVTKPGNYPITLTASNDSGLQKSFHFNITVKAIPQHLFGKYSNCKKYCTSGGGPFTDSIYLDPVIPNKIWFTNFGNWGNLVYGHLTGYGTLTIPNQVSGGMTYNYLGTFSIGRHINMGFSSNCAMDMW